VLDVLQDWDGERSRFAGSGASLTEDIDSPERTGNDSCLNWRGFEIRRRVKRSKHDLG
jgi:hypothetical protein